MSFKKKDKDAAKIYQDISPDVPVEADHIHPKSKGGADDVANLQFIDPTANRAKSDHAFVPRQWQMNFLQEWDRSTVDSFLCVAIPGGGKTRAALSAAHRFLQAGHDRRLLIIGPTINVRRQWEIEALRLLGIKLQTKEFGANFKSGFMGAVATYSALASSAELFRKVCASAPTLVILDEPHHLADDSVWGTSAWGTSALHAFELATRRLLLSGTPFRTDGRPIPFVRYDGGGVCLDDFRYDYPHALQDGVVRTLVFDYSHGSYEELFKGDRRTFEFNGEISEREAAERLQQILNASGDFVAQMVRLAHAKLKMVRQSIPDAGAMAVCIDMMHAQRIAEVIRRETGCQPGIVVSDDSIATDTVEAYRRGRSEWLVSVRQVTEGTDIKRLQVLCYFTTATTELIFRQLIGRISRVRYQDPDSPRVSDEAGQADLEAYVFLPADPRLIAHAKNIEDAQRRALLEAPVEGPPRTSPERTDSVRMFLDSAHNGREAMIVAGRSYNAEEADQIHRLAGYGIKIETAARIFDAEFRDVTRHQNAPVMANTVDDETEEDRMDKLRIKINKLAYKYALKIKCEAWQVNGQWPPHRTMSLIELEAKHARLIELLQEAQR